MSAPTNALNELAYLHQTNVKGLQNLSDSANQDDANLVVKRPWIDEPSGSNPFDEQGGKDIPALGTSTIILSFLVPDGQDGVIKFVSCNVNFGGFVQFSGDLVWRILIDKRPAKNFSNIQATKGTIEQGRAISPLRIYSGQLVEWEVTHAANGLLAGQTICSLTGYTYPSRGVA